jgi:hypothetical protein
VDQKQLLQSKAIPVNRLGQEPLLFIIGQHPHFPVIDSVASGHSPTPIMRAFYHGTASMTQRRLSRKNVNFARMLRPDDA